jgi:hypothetical protein
MEKISGYLIAGLSVFAFAACDDSVRERETNPPVSAEKVDSVALSGKSAVIDSLIKTDTGIFRGVTFGMPIEKVKELEKKSELEEESEELLDYIINYNFPESAEVLYYKDEREQVSKIEAVIYPEGKDSQKKVFDELLKYYKGRYGEPVLTEGDTLRWQSPLDNFVLLLSKKDGQKVHDINLIFKSADKQATGKAL